MKKLSYISAICIALLFLISLLLAVAPAYDHQKAYAAGDSVTYGEEVYTAKWWTQGNDPDKSKEAIARGAAWESPWEPNGPVHEEAEKPLVSDDRIKIAEETGVTQITKDFEEIDDKDLDEIDDDNLDEFAEYVGRLVLSSYRSIANALNSQIIAQQVQDIRDEDPSDILEKEQLVEFSQLIYNAIFELKKRYYEAILYNNWSQKYIQIMLRMQKMKNQNVSAQEILQLLPSRLLPIPALERIPKDKLIESLKQLAIEPPMESGAGAE